MADSLASTLADIRNIARRTDRLAEAERQLLQLIKAISAVELIQGEPLIRSTIDSGFLPKRRKALVQALERALVGTGSPRTQESVPVSNAGSQDPLFLLRQEVTASFTDLA